MSQSTTSTGYKLRVCHADPYADLIERFVIREFPSAVKSTKCAILELITEAIVASGQIRYGPVPSPESLVAMRQIIRHWMEQSRPIPVLIAWGSEKPDSTGIDVAELSALKTLISLQERVKVHYPPGLQINIRIEDASAPHLFFERVDAARQEAKLYTYGFVTLIGILGLSNFIKPVPESTLISEDHFNAFADSIMPLMSAHVYLPEDPKPLQELAARKLHWTPITQETVNWYLHCYEKLYPNASKPDRLHRLARYFTGALARRAMKITGEETCWQTNFLELSFLSVPPGVDTSRYTRRIQYRTLPSSITSNHMPPWRAKGYLRVGKTEVTAALASYRAPNAYNQFQITLEKDGISQVVQTDYVVV